MNVDNYKSVIGTLKNESLDFRTKLRKGSFFSYGYIHSQKTDYAMHSKATAFFKSISDPVAEVDQAPVFDSDLWFLYIACCTDMTLYTGITTDLKRRMSEHGTKKGAK